MIPLLLALLATATAATVALTVHVHRSRSWLTKRTGERIIVHTSDSQTIEGTLTATAADGIVLLAPRLVDVEITMAGDVWIPRPKIVMIQRAA